MGGTPWSKYKNPEVVSEGGPWAKYGADFDSPREAVDALPEFLTRTADEKNAQRADANNRALVGKLPKLNSAAGRAGTFANQYINSSAVGLGDTVNAGIDTVLGIDTMGDSFASRKGNYRDTRGDMIEANPMSALAGEIGGYLAPGTAAWKGMSAAGKAIPGVAALNSAAQSAGRVPAYMSRLLGSAGLFTADATLYGGTVGASNEAALTGQDASLGDRARVGKDYALANAGDMGEAMGVDVPSFFKPIPVAPLMPFAGSVIERGIKGVGSGGKMVTPDRVQAEVLNNVGRAPSPNSTAAAMADVIPAERATSGTVKTFRFIENALRNGLKDAGLASAEITDRVTRGFNSIHKSLPALADGSTTLAQLIEREFADAGPQVSENLRLFLLRVGLDDPAVTRGVIDEMRTGQVEDFRQAIDQNFGGQDTYTAETKIRKGLDKIGEGFNQVLEKAREQSNNSPLSHSLRDQLKRTDMKFELKSDASKRGWKDVDTFIDQDPWRAGHILQSKLAKLAENAAGSGSSAYAKFREPVVWIKEFLNEVPGYRQMADTYAKEATVLDTLGHTKKVGSKEITTPGFGPQLRKDARRARDVARRADEYGAMPARQQDAAKLSTGEVLKDQLRTARPGGTNLEGQDLLGLRLTDLQNEGMMSTHADMPGALPAVFGEAGERVSQKADDIVNSRRFLADIDPKTGSNTVNKANAQMSGDSVITSGLPRTMTSGYTQSGLIDATMFASGLPPVATMLTKGIPALGKVFGPGRGTRANIAETLLQRPARRGQPPAPPSAIPPMSGRNRPRAWRTDDKWSDPNLSNPQIEPPIQNGFFGFGKKKPAVNPDEFFTDSHSNSAVMSPRYPSAEADDAARGLGLGDEFAGDASTAGLRQRTNESLQQFEQMVTNNPNKQSFVFSLPESPEVQRETVEQMLKVRDRRRWGPGKKADTVLVMSADGGDMALVDRALTQRGGAFATTEATQGSGVNWFRINDVSDFDAVPYSSKNVATRGKPSASNGLPMLSGPAATGAVVGGTSGSVVDYNQDGKTDATDMAIGALIGGIGGKGAGRLDRAGRSARALPQKQTNKFTTSGGNSISVSSGRLENGDAFIDFSNNGSQYGRGADTSQLSLGETNEVLRGVGQEVRRVLTDEQPQRLVIGAHTDQQERIYRAMLERADLQGYQLSREMTNGGPALVLSRSDVKTNGIGGRRRKDVLRDAAQSQFPATQAPRTPPGGLPQRQADPGGGYAPVGDGGEGLGLLLGGGAAAGGAMALNEYANRPPQAGPPARAASSQSLPMMAAKSAQSGLQRREQGLPFPPNVKPDMSGNVEQLNQAAFQQSKQEMQALWGQLGTNERLAWNQMREERAAELEIRPEEAQAGVVDKRLLPNGELQILMQGEWRTAAPAQ